MSRTSKVFQICLFNMGWSKCGLHIWGSWRQALHIHSWPCALVQLIFLSNSCLHFHYFKLAFVTLDLAFILVPGLWFCFWIFSPILPVYSPWWTEMRPSGLNPPTTTIHLDLTFSWRFKHPQKNFNFLSSTKLSISESFLTLRDLDAMRMSEAQDPWQPFNCYS